MAFSLVEVTIALAVAGFCLIAILGLLHSGLTSERATVEQTVATGILSTVFADLASTPLTNSTSQKFQLSLTGTSLQTLYFSEGGKLTGSAGSPPSTTSRYRASVLVQPSTSTGVTAPTAVRLLVTWPAAADPQPAQWPSKQAGAVEVVTSLNRN